MLSLRRGPFKIYLDFFQTDDEILAAFGADDSEDEKYDEADDAERKRDSSNEQRMSRVRIPFARDNYFFVDIVVKYLALDITANCF